MGVSARGREAEFAIERSVTVVDLEGEHSEGGAHHPSSRGADPVGVGIERAFQFSLSALEGEHGPLEVQVPRLPRIAPDVEEGEGRVVPVVTRLIGAIPIGAPLGIGALADQSNRRALRLRPQP